MSKNKIKKSKDYENTESQRYYVVLYIVHIEVVSHIHRVCENVLLPSVSLHSLVIFHFEIRESATTSDVKLVSVPEGIPEKGTRAALMGEPRHSRRLGVAGRSQQGSRGYNRHRWSDFGSRSFLSRRRSCGQSIYTDRIFVWEKFEKSKSRMCVLFRHYTECHWFQSQVAPHKAEFILIPQDGDGPMPEVLRETLRKREISGAKMPKVMYINATGTNPNGIIIPLERRKEIYSLACEYNFLILDDDPYHFLHYEEVRINFFFLRVVCIERK